MGDNFVEPWRGGEIVKRTTNPIEPPPIPKLQTIELPASNYKPTDHDVVKLAQATLIHARADIAVFGAITLALVVLLWLLQGGNLLVWGLAGLLLWGLAGLLALNRNRAQGFYHSPPGVEHHRLDAAERLAARQQELDDARAGKMTDAYIKHLEAEGDYERQQKLKG